MLDPIRSKRLLLRCWEPSDAPRLKEAIDCSLPELRMWVPWAIHEPSPMEALAQRLAGFRDRFVSGEDWAFGVFDPDGLRVLGGAGLHPRGGPDDIEIGYWIRTDATGQGLATEAAAALCAAAFDRPGIARVEIHCDTDNVRSAAIPRRLGFQLRGTTRRDSATRGPDREIQIWGLDRDRYGTVVDVAALIEEERNRWP